MPFLFWFFSLFSRLGLGCRRPILQDWRIQRAGGGEREGAERALHLHMMRHLVLHPHIRINDPEVLTEIR